jgi:hypothetical protein
MYNIPGIAGIAGRPKSSATHIQKPRNIAEDTPEISPHISRKTMVKTVLKMKGLAIPVTPEILSVLLILLSTA